MSSKKSDIKKIKKNWARSPALKRAQKKYMKRLKTEEPERYRKMINKISRKQYEKNKMKPEFKQKNRQAVKDYYYRNKQKISEKRKIYYQNKKIAEQLKKKNLTK